MNVLDETAEERLTCFLYLLTRDSLAWGEMSRVLRESSAGPNTYTSSGAEAMARSFARELLGLPHADAGEPEGDSAPEPSGVPDAPGRWWGRRTSAKEWDPIRVYDLDGVLWFGAGHPVDSYWIEWGGPCIRGESGGASKLYLMRANALEAGQAKLQAEADRTRTKLAALRKRVEIVIADVPHTDECYSGEASECDCWQSKIRKALREL